MDTRESKFSVTTMFRKLFTSSKKEENEADSKQEPGETVESVEKQSFPSVEQGLINPMFSDNTQHGESEIDEDSVVAYGGDVSSVYDDDR